MKSILTVTFFSLLATHAFAGDHVIKACQTSSKSLDNPTLVVETKIEIIKRGDEYVARIAQSAMGQKNEFEQKAEISESTVKAGLDGNLDDVDNLNLSEKLIAHAMSLSEIDPDKTYFDAGLDLKAVRSAKVYSFGEEGDMGMTAIVEAKDEKGKDLGSFFGGFLVSPCK